MKKFLAIIFLFLFTFNLSAQDDDVEKDSVWNALLVKKGKVLKPRYGIPGYKNGGIALYKNCFYEIDLKNKKHISGRLVGIKPDTLYFTNFFNAHIVSLAHSKLDTFPVPAQNIANFYSAGQQYWSKYSMDDYYIFFRLDTDFLASHDSAQIFRNDKKKYELVSCLSNYGLSQLFEEDGKIYYYNDTGIVNPFPAKHEKKYQYMNVFWYTPCKVEEINGLALGADAVNLKNDLRDSLVINGLNISLATGGFFNQALIPYYFTYPDSLNSLKETFDNTWQIKIHGINLAALGNAGDIGVSGLSITAIGTAINQMNGLAVSGLGNSIVILNGISISASNRAKFAKGAQIGLFNRADDLRGIQIGLWNKNAKRSLPLINWQFRAKKKKIRKYSDVSK